MKITVLYGQMHHGSTYNITKLLLDEFKDDTTEVIEYFLPKEAPVFCTGCFTCFNKGESLCPHYDYIGPIAKDIEDADLIIAQSPCYVMNMSGQLKAFFDHMAYRWMPHRPHKSMFKKVGITISTSAGSGSSKVSKLIKQNLMYWGIPVVRRIYSNVNASSWAEIKESKKTKIYRDVKRTAEKAKSDLSKRKTGIYTKILFMLMRLLQKSNKWNKTDQLYWQEQGWLEKVRPWHIQ